MNLAALIFQCLHVVTGPHLEALHFLSEIHGRSKLGGAVAAAVIRKKMKMNREKEYIKWRFVEAA